MNAIDVGTSGAGMREADSLTVLEDVFFRKQQGKNCRTKEVANGPDPPPTVNHPDQMDTNNSQILRKRKSQKSKGRCSFLAENGFSPG